MNEYFRFELERTLGLICSPNCNVLYDADGKYAISGALESVYVWNLRTAQVMQEWTDVSNKKAQAQLICRNPASTHIYAVGYSDGTIRLWDIRNASLGLVFSGHKGAITALAFSQDGTRLASGSRDSEIVLWDLISELGLYRLRGHSNAITGLCFLGQGHGHDDDQYAKIQSEQQTLLSCSKDTLIKIWDLPSQHCIETVVSCHVELSALCLDPLTDRLFVAGADKKVRVFRLLPANVQNKLEGAVTGEGGDEHSAMVVKEEGCFNRGSTSRVVWMSIDENCGHLAILGSDRSLEICKILSQEEGKEEGKEEVEENNEKSKKKKKTSNKKKIEESTQLPSNSPLQVPSNSSLHLKQLLYTRLQSKARSFEFNPKFKMSKSQGCQGLCGFVDNQLAQISTPLGAPKEGEEPVTLLNTIDQNGHRSEVRLTAFNREDFIFATASREQIKIWNPQSGSLLRTILCDEPTALTFAFQGRALLIGSKDGTLSIADLASGDVVESIAAHEGSINCLTCRPDGKGLVSGGADKTVKFWEFKTAKTLFGKKLALLKTLQMGDDVLVARYSPDLRFVAISTLDMTIKVFFADTLRFFLSLYGHKLPVVDLDISHDGRLLISASSDKNVKIWSLEFGECRKSIFAHTEALTSIAFLPQRRLFLTTSKDGLIKYWDADRFLELQRLTSHHDEVWAMAINDDGSCIATVSKDHSIRVWRVTDEELFPEEEQERQVEEQFEQSMLQDNPYERGTSEQVEESGRATQKTAFSLKAGDRLMEAIEAADEERRNREEYAEGMAKGLSPDKPTPNPLFLVGVRVGGEPKTPAELVLWAFEQTPLPDIEEALLCLSTNTIPSLLLYIQQWFQTRRNVVMASRVLDMLIRLFHQSIISTPSLRLVLESIRQLERETLQEFKNGHDSRRQLSPSPVRERSPRRERSPAYEARPRSRSPPPPPPPRGGGDYYRDAPMPPRDRERDYRDGALPHRERDYQEAPPRRDRNQPDKTRLVPPQPSSVLGVFGLSHETRQRDLEDIFGKYGPLKQVVLVIDRRTGQSRGFGFIYFEQVEDAEKALERTNGMRLDGRYIRVDFSYTNRPHSPTPGVYMGESTARREHRSRDRYYDRRRPSYRSRSRSPHRRGRSRERYYEQRESYGGRDYRRSRSRSL